MTTEQLVRLHQLVHDSQAVVERPWEPGETSRPITFFTDHLTNEGWRLGWTLLGALREQHATLFRYYGEEGLHRAALDFVLSSDAAPSLVQVAEFLMEDVDGEGLWLVCVPLANVALDRAWAPLAERIVLWRAPEAHRIEDRALQEAASEEEFLAETDVFRHLGDRLSPAPRTLRMSAGPKLDTGRTVTLLSAETGPPAIAIEAARGKAHYALATWSLLKPPADWHLLPDLGVWSPQPFLHQRARHKRLEDNRWIHAERTRGGDYRHWAPYDLPGDDVLRAPFEAFEHLNRRSAQALLSGTAAIYSGQRASRSQLSERIRDVRAAIECLCEPACCEDGHVRERWERLAQRFAVWDQVADARAYTPSTVAQLQQRLVDARNISAHGADAALIDLGWTAGDRPLRRGRQASATDLTVTALHRDLGPMLYAVGEALRHAWNAMRDAQFDDAVFEGLFGPAPG